MTRDKKFKHQGTLLVRIRFFISISVGFLGRRADCEGRDKVEERLTQKKMSGAAVAGHNVFVYGSLLADDVVRVLLNRVPPTASAVLPDFRRFSIKGRVYPAIVPVEADKVSGRVLLGITDPELYILDEFEDVEYERRTVEVSLTDSLEKLQAEAYVWVNKDDPNLYGSWDFEEWKQLHKEGFMQMTREFREEMELPESKTRVATYESFYQQDDSAAPPAS